MDQETAVGVLDSLTRRDTDTNARRGAGASKNTRLMKSAFWLGLCGLVSSAASASTPPSGPSTCGEIKNHDRNNARARVIADGSEGENTHDDYYDSIPWQTSPSNFQSIDEAARYEDMPPSVFSPTGRLHPVEAAVRASKAATPMSNLLLAMRCRDGLLVISTFPVSPHVDASRVAIFDDTDANATRTNTSSHLAAASTANETANASGSNQSSFYPSLFLFDETSASTTTGSIFDIHPCIVAATAGNAVDNRIMRTKLLALGLSALENQGAVEEDVRAKRVAKDLANQLQVVTQDIAMAQKHNLGRLLASSAVILGNRKIWRIDPTGQFWDCHATAIGADADQTEMEFHRRLLDECKLHQLDSVPELLDSISQNKALALVEDFIEARLAKQRSSPTKSSQSSAASSTQKSEADAIPDPQSQFYWQALILDFSLCKTGGTPRRKLKRGIFGVRNKL